MSSFIEQTPVSVAVSDTTGLDINIIGIDFDVQLDTTLTVKVPGFAARVFPARFEAQLRNVKFMGRFWQERICVCFSLFPNIPGYSQCGPAFCG